MKKFFILALSLTLLLCGVSSNELKAQDIRRMTIEELKSQMNDQNILVLDVRREGDWKSSASKIKGALRARPSEFDAWAGLYPKDKRLVLY